MECEQTNPYDGALLNEDAEISEPSATVAGCDTVMILPGHYCATRCDVTLVTVLGSCVAVCLYDPVNGVAGMNHYLLPEPPGLPQATSEIPTRYGTAAVAMLVGEMLAEGAERQHMVAKVFGGASVLRDIPDHQRVGPRNVAFALGYLRNAGIPVVQYDVGGIGARSVSLRTRDGRVAVRRSAQYVNLAA
ncbi:MAG: chemoreceptor glutamine deamidase CheD [Burkholderiales bacterium]|nr:chemoreceptor glutamine deamidase CheD [Burkholderiales bacterium]